MTDCEKALAHVEEMLRLIRATPEGERGFVACERDGQIEIGKRCEDSGDRCTIEGPPCPEGAKPVYSFHTHRTAGLTGAPGRALLLPSPRDLGTGERMGTPVACVGGSIGEDAHVWCFPTLAGAPPIQRALTQVHAAQVESEIERALLSDRPASVSDALAAYFASVAAPCLEIHIPAEKKLGEQSRCTVCGR